MKKIFTLLFILSISLNTNAQITFQKTFPSYGGYSYGRDVRQTTDGGYIVTGAYEVQGIGFKDYLVKTDAYGDTLWTKIGLSLIHISEPTRLLSISYAVFCLKKK